MEREQPPGMPPCESKCGGNERKRRFSDEQVRSLECMFEEETKLEPRRKAQVAWELGLQPRQVAVWFQNRRARWKSKQLEREYLALRADYDALLSSFDTLKEEKQSLAAQLKRLAELLEKPAEENSDSGNSGDGNSDSKQDRKPSWLPMEGSHELRPVGAAGSSEGGLISNTKEQVNIPCVSEPTISSLALADRLCCFDGAGSISDQSCSTSSDWWELWTQNA